MKKLTQAIFSALAITIMLFPALSAAVYFAGWFRTDRPAISQEIVTDEPEVTAPEVCLELPGSGQTDEACESNPFTGAR